MMRRFILCYPSPRYPTVSISFLTGAAMAASLLFRSRSGGALHFSCRRYSRSGWEESGQIPAFPPGHSATPPAIRRAEEVEAEGGISRTFPPTTSRRRSEIAVTSSAAGIAPTFWSHEVQYVVPSELSRSYAFDRAVDKRSRFVVRSRLREDGAVSNLYPIYFPQEVAEGSNNGGGGGGGGGRTSATKAPLYVYEMYVTRVVRDATTTGTGGRGLVASDDITRTGASARKGKSGCGSRRSAEGEGYVSMTTGTEKVVEKRVEPRRAWKAIRRFLQRRFGSSLPPVVQLEQRVYATGPLPDEALKVPAEYHDLGWHKCELRTVSHCVYTQLSAPQMQELTNAIVMWSIWGKEQLQGYAVAHKNKRKLVCTEAGVSSNGLRVYRGTIVDAIFVDDSDAAAYDGFTCTSGSTSSGQTATASATSPSLSLSPPPSTRTLGEAKAGVLTGAEPVFFRIESFIRSFVYGKRPVESYKIADASGAFLASLWDPPVGHLPLQSGDVFAAPASTVRIHVFPERGNMRLVEMRIAEVRPATEEELHTLGVKPRAAAEKARNSRKSQKAAMDNSKPTSSSSSQQQQQPLTGFPGRLSLKIDTKGTIASEMSMWDEVKQHFGPGPYSEEEQRRITRAVQGTPVVISYSLRQSIVRLVRFYDSSTGTISIARHADGEDAREEGDSNDRVEVAHSVRASSRNELTVPAVRTEHSETGVFSHRMMDPGLVPHIPELEVNQPIAVLPDYTMVPLQALHCCFDPRMKGWQETAIAVLSLMPEKRAKVLEQFRGKLSEGLAQWGLTLATEPLRSKSISLLPAPQKSFNTPMNYLVAAQGRHLRHPAPVSFPTTILVVGVAGTRRTSEERNRIALTAQNVAQSFKTSLVACVTEEKEAVAFMAQQVLIPAAAGASSQQQQLRDANVALLLITSEKESRATRWVTAECLSRGVLPIVVSPVSSPSRVNLLTSGIKRQMSTKFESNPLRGIDLCREVPVLRGKRLLSVGVDTCHTSTQSVGSVVCLLSVPERNHVLSIFWRQEARGQEAQLVSAHFKILLTKAAAMYDGLDEVVVFQDGDLFSELNSMSDELAACVPGCGMTFMCLHKRTNIRLFHEAPKGGYAGAGAGGGGGADIPVRNNIVKGALMPALTPVVLDYEEDASSFYLQTHDSNMSTARTVHYTVHRTSPTLEVGDIQQISNVMANVLSPQSTKLPMPTRCAHKLADKAERLLDAVPQLRCDMIPSPLSERLWFM